MYIYVKNIINFMSFIKKKKSLYTDVEYSRVRL
jgi:hypothetical protein